MTVRSHDMPGHHDATPSTVATISPAPDERPIPFAEIGRQVGGGMTWMMFTTLFTRVMTFAAQVVLGWKLSEQDFGLFAIAVTVAGFLMVCRDAAVRELLIQRGEGGYRRLSGSAFWLAITYNFGVGAVIAALAIPLSYVMFGDRSMAEMLWLMALALPIGTPSGILQSKLRLEMRFAAFSAQIAATSIVRQSATILLALMDFGAMSLAIPVVVVAIFDSISTYIITRDAPWLRKPRPRVWPKLVTHVKWLMFGNLANIALDFGAYLLISPTLRIIGIESATIKGIVGVYFFAYQIAAQIGALLSYNVQLVFLPALSLLKDDPERQMGVAVRALRALMLLGSVSCVGLVAIISPLEHLIWRGRWVESINAVVILGIFYPWRVSFGLCATVLMAQGRFRAYAFISFIEGMGLMIVACAAAALLASDDVAASATGIAWCTGLWLFVSRLAATIWIFHTSGVGYSTVLGALFPAWVISVVAGGAGLAADHWVNIGPAISSALGGETPSWLDITIADSARVLLAGGTCTAVFIALARWLIADHLRDAVRAVPRRLRGLTSRLFLLGPVEQ